jgi:hypothetical protein
MEERANKAAAREFQKEPEAGVSKKTEKAIKKMGAKPNHNLVEELAVPCKVQVVAYRQEGRGVKGAELLHRKGVSMAVRKVVVDCEKPSTK